MRITATLFLVQLCLAAAGWSRDTTLVVSGPLPKEGVIRLDAYSRRTDSSAVELQAIRFQFTPQLILTLRNTGLPDFNASCSGASYSALLVEPTLGVTAGFYGKVDTVWEAAYRVPNTLTALDSIKERYPMFTGRKALIGKGWIHSVDAFSGCKMEHGEPYKDFQRILYSEARNGDCLKAQVDSIETEPAQCDTSVHPPCSKLKYVHIRYAITASSGCQFSEPPTAVRPMAGRGLRFRDALPRPVWEYVLGRTP
jgi:hypothetical protein